KRWPLRWHSAPLVDNLVLESKAIVSGLASNSCDSRHKKCVRDKPPTRCTLLPSVIGGPGASSHEHKQGNTDRDQAKQAQGPARLALVCALLSCAGNATVRSQESLT